MRISLASIVAGIALITPVPLLAQLSLRTIMVTGDPAPSDLPGATFVAPFPSPTINNYGSVGFTSSMSINSVQQSGVFLHTSQQFIQVTRTGLPAPGSSETFAAGFSSTAISDNGQVSFCSGINPTEGWYALARYAPPQGTIIAQQNTPAPGLGAANYRGVCSRTGNLLAPPAMNASGDVAYYSELSTGFFGLYKTTPGGTVQVARENSFTSALPFVRWAGIGAEEDYSNATSSALWPTLNDNGVNAFAARLSGNGVTPANERSIWTHSGTLSLRARSGDTPPGFDPGVQFSSFGDPSINNAGHLVFKADLTGTGIDQNNNAGIWSNVFGQFAPVAREGDLAPGLNGSATFSNFRTENFQYPIINANGDAAFMADVAGPGITTQNDSGLWAQRNGLLTLIAREGDQAPGTLAGTLFSESTFQDFFPQMNSLGQLVFKASLTGPGVTTANDQGIWAMLEDGSVHLLVREDDTLEIRPGVFRTLGSNAFFVRAPSGGQDGRQRTLNDSGEFAFSARFTTGEQAILVLDIPEPASVAMFIMAVTFSLCRKKRYHLI